MHKLLPYILLVLLALCGVVVQAQEIDYDSTYTTIDTVGSIDDLKSTVEEPYNEGKEKAHHFDPILSIDKTIIDTRKVNDNELNQMRKDEDFWYVNVAPQKEIPKQPKESALSKLAKQAWFRNLLWVMVIGGFIAVLIWFIVSSDIHLFKRPSVAIANKEADELVNQSIFDINYDIEVQKAISNQNFRMAIRLLYLQTLKRLAEENIINYKHERTNGDYLMQLFNTSYYKDFFRLTRHFEYAWYGQFPVAPASFEVINNEFVSFKHRFLS